MSYVSTESRDDSVQMAVEVLHFASMGDLKGFVAF